MTSVGYKVKRAFRKVGVSFSIVGSSADTEYCILETNAQATKPFIKEFFKSVSFAYDTEVVAGDVVEIAQTGEKLLVVHLSSELLEDAFTEKQGVVYKCNVSGELSRLSGESWDRQSFRQVSEWVTVESNLNGLLTENLFGTGLEIDEEIGQLGLESSSLYISSSAGARELDRFSPASGEYYKITAVESRKFNSVDICKLEEDTRD